MKLSSLINRMEEYLNSWWGTLPIEALEEITGLEFDDEVFFNDVDYFWNAMNILDKAYIHEEHHTKYDEYTKHIILDEFIQEPTLKNEEEN